jgi:hypothetical protein
MSITRYEHEDIKARSKHGDYIWAERVAREEGADVYCARCGGQSFNMEADVTWQVGKGWVYDYCRDSAFYCHSEIKEDSQDKYASSCGERGECMYVKLDGDSIVVDHETDPETLTPLQQERLATLQLVEDYTRLEGVGHRISQWFFLIE